ncbi:hypothetical protein BVC80_237g48 [Macleaya cordata]|uniref:Uncharacterized protein n=1 Tax=Macleaya cordata TaxID=56857 RepID=A0A200RB71_MACCD|nr:hypothetical protein BVC80_237g48 [Macleaya cordata]
MVDGEEEGEETSSRGNEWEVVSLTASTYAASPGPKGLDPNNDDKGNEFGGDEVETSHPMFMSKHFVFPPNKHENLPLEPDNNSHIEGIFHDEVSGLNVEEGEISDKNDEKTWNIRGLEVLEKLHGTQFFDEKGNTLPFCEEGNDLQGLNLVAEENSINNAAKISSFHDEANISGSTVTESTISEPSDPLNLDSPLEIVKSQNPSKENESGLPCEAWWKKRAASWYAQAKDADAFWSVFVAAALMGIVILGQRWQQERWQIQQLKWQFSINDEKMNRMMSSISRFKDVIVGGGDQRRSFYVIRANPSAER